ncbi:MAG TPA: putative quinol monooxygenase [Pseudomonadales bacterium]|nr:putative quinol monooxygenase [Pseudomonadales bacterium]
MIIVTCSIVARSGSEDALYALSAAHAERSRGEPGCIRHQVLKDPAAPDRLYFHEQWEDKAALRAHFRMPHSAQFVRCATALTEGDPEVSVFEARPVCAV